MGYKFYGYNLSKSRKLRKDIQMLLSYKRNVCLNSEKLEQVNSKIIKMRQELNGLIVKGEPFDLFKGLEV